MDCRSSSTAVVTIRLTLYNLPVVMDGDLDRVLNPLMAHALNEKLAALKT